MADRTNEYLKAVKDGKVVAVGEKGTKKVSVNGLAANTDFAEGNYKIAFDQDGESALSLKASDLVDDPAFKTLPVKVTGVSLDNSTLSVEVGKIFQLKATIAPSNASDKAVTYASSDESVATIDGSGKGTTKKAGSTDITVTTHDGSKTAKCTVTVKNATVSVTGVSLDKTEISVEEGATVQLAATVAPTNATDKAVAWKSNDTNTATVDGSGKVTGVKAKEGAVDITVTTKDGSKTAACAVTVTAPKA